MRRTRFDIAKHGPLLRIEDASELTGLDAVTIQQEIEDGYLPAYRLTRRKLFRINRADLERWVRKRVALIGAEGPDGIATFAVEDLMIQPVVYRLLGRDGELLYIGSTKNIANRLRGHARVQPWWRQVKRVGIQRFESLQEARIAEPIAIALGRPKHNVVRPFVDQAALREAGHQGGAK